MLTYSRSGALLFLNLDYFLSEEYSTRIFHFQNVRDAAKNVLKWTSRTAGVVSSSDLGAGQETLEYFVQVSCIPGSNPVELS